MPGGPSPVPYNTDFCLQLALPSFKSLLNLSANISGVNGQLSEEEKAMLGYDETQEDPIFEDEDFIEVDSDEDFEF